MDDLLGGPEGSDSCGFFGSTSWSLLDRLACGGTRVASCFGCLAGMDWRDDERKKIVMHPLNYMNKAKIKINKK